MIGAAGEPWTVLADVTVPARSSLPAFEVAAGDVLRIEDVDGQQAADIVIAPVDQPGDWLSCIYTQLLNGTTRVTTGHTLYSKLARRLAAIVEDTVGVHWFGGGFCSAETNQFRYGVDSGSCRANLAASLAGSVAEPLGLELDACASLFMNIEVTVDHRLGIALPHSRPGDHIDLLAETDLLVAVSACPQERNPCNGYQPSAIRLVTLRPGGGERGGGDGGGGGSERPDR